MKDNPFDEKNAGREKYHEEAFVKTTSEITKFFSSIERVENYSSIDIERKTGDARPHIFSTDFTEYKKWIYHSPKLSRREFEALLKDDELYDAYMRQVLLKNDNDLYPFHKLDQNKTNELYIEAIKDLESDWNFHRAFYKVFRDVSGETMLFLDLQAFGDTRHFRFIMRELFNYLEGNYVTTLRKENKVFIPQLQFAMESINLPYSSYFDMTLENLVADYILKEKINSVNDILLRFDAIEQFRADVAKEEKEPIFLKTSRYIDHSEYSKCLKKWITSMKNMKIDFSNRESIVKNINFETLELPDSIFREESRLHSEDVSNYESDKRIFYSHKTKDYGFPRWKRRVIRELFRDLSQYSINRYRIEEQSEQRTEYEEVFRSYKNMTHHEKDVACLLVEDGEISFVLLLERSINEPSILDNPDQLLYWGFVKKSGNQLYITRRAVRMAKWCMKVMNIKYQKNGIELDYDKLRIKQSYSELTDPKRIFSWMKVDKKLRGKIGNALGEIIHLQEKPLTQPDILEIFKNICDLFYHKQPDKKDKIETALKNSRFQKDLNEWLRAHETINRAVIAVPVNTIPSEIESKLRTFSIFIGTFHMDEQLYTDNEEEFIQARRDMVNKLNHIRIFYSLIGIPASESLNAAILKQDTQKHIDSTLGRFTHKVKNEGVNLVTRMNNVANMVEGFKELKQTKLLKEIMVLKEGVERLTGSINIQNIAANGLKWWYMEHDEYCILDVILKAYFNAFQQFFLSGPEEERIKFQFGKNKDYINPVLKLHVEFYKKRNSVIRDKIIAYNPELEETHFINLNSNAEQINYILDSDDVLGDNSLDFANLLPQKLIMTSPFFEVFYNAFTHTFNFPDAPNILELMVKRNPQEIIIELTNEIEPALRNQLLTEQMKNSPGLQANMLFFQNIGGSLYLKFKEKAMTRITINLSKMMQLLEKHGGIDGTIK